MAGVRVSGAGQAFRAKLPRVQLSCCQIMHRVPPLRGNGHQRIEDEAPLRQPGMRDLQTRPAQDHIASRKDIEIKHPITPTPAPPPAKVALDGFERAQQIGQIARPIQRRHGIGIAAAAGANGCGIENGRDLPQRPQSGQCRQHGTHHAGRPAMAAVTAVRSQRDKHDCHMGHSPYRHNP
jgi:hypothetical protein